MNMNECPCCSWHLINGVCNRCGQVVETKEFAPQLPARPFGGMCEGQPGCKNPAMPGDFICLECAAHMLGDKW